MDKNNNHQFIEMKSGKTEGNMAYKDVMCADCGEMKRMHEDGKMETMKKGNMTEDKGMMSKKEDMKSDMPMK